MALNMHYTIDVIHNQLMNVSHTPYAHNVGNDSNKFANLPLCFASCSSSCNTSNILHRAYDTQQSICYKIY